MIAPELRGQGTVVSAFNALRKRIIELDGCYLEDVGADIMEILHRLAPARDRRTTDCYTILTQRLGRYLFTVVPGSQASLIEMEWGCESPSRLNIAGASARVQRITKMGCEWIDVPLSNTALEWAKRLHATRIDLNQDMGRVFLSSRRKRFKTTGAFSSFLKRHFDHE